MRRRQAHRRPRSPKLSRCWSSRRGLARYSEPELPFGPHTASLPRDSTAIGAIGATRASFFRMWLRAAHRLREPISPPPSRLICGREYRHRHWHGALATKPNPRAALPRRTVVLGGLRLQTPSASATLDDLLMTTRRASENCPRKRFIAAASGGRVKLTRGSEF
jgi:hypothetical protein